MLAHRITAGSRNSGPATKCTAEPLGKSIHLIVVPTMWKRKHLSPKVVQPMCPHRQKHRTGFYARGLLVHAHDLVSAGIDSDGVNVLASQILDQAHSGSLVFNDEKSIGTHFPPLPVEIEYLAPQVWIIELLPDDVENENGVTPDQQDHAGRVV